jgi:hypothetical protein
MVTYELYDNEDDAWYYDSDIKFVLPIDTEFYWCDMSYVVHDYVFDDIKQEVRVICFENNKADISCEAYLLQQKRIYKIKHATEEKDDYSS